MEKGKMRVRLSQKECLAIYEALQIMDHLPWGLEKCSAEELKEKLIILRKDMSKPIDICGTLHDLRRRFSCLADPDCDFIARGSRRRSR